MQRARNSRRPCTRYRNFKVAGPDGQIGLTGCASVVTNAVYHATGVRELPVRIEKLLKTA